MPRQSKHRLKRISDRDEIYAQIQQGYEIFRPLNRNDDWMVYGKMIVAVVDREIITRMLEIKQVYICTVEDYNLLLTPNQWLARTHNK